MRSIALAATLLLSVTACNWLPEADAAKRTCTDRSQCCKVCDRGNACGNTCIPANRACHKGRGCACDVEELCE